MRGIGEALGASLFDFAHQQSHMCVSSLLTVCVGKRQDVTEGIATTVTMDRCSGCGRFSVPPHHWQACELESKELLSICLKKIHGLDKVKLIDASFLWTEPHSKRLKVKLTVQKDVFNGVTLQQSMVAEFILKNLYCKNCHMIAAEISWTCVVQIRQKVDNKRTLYLLEQLIIKHKAHTRTVSVKEVPDGIDFFFLHRRDADRFSNFVLGSVPCKFHGYFQSNENAMLYNKSLLPALHQTHEFHRCAISSSVKAGLRQQNGTASNSVLSLGFAGRASK